MKKEKPKVKSKKQWPTWKAPFQPGCNLHTFSQAMMKKGGMTLKEFDKLVAKTGASRSFILRCLRKGNAGGWTWEFDDSNGYKITDVRLNRKGI